MSVLRAPAGEALPRGSDSRRNARRAGLRRGDVIVRVDDQPVRARGELMLAIAARDIGETIRVEIRRRDQRLVIAVRLEALRGS